jgi:hypothetical protein
MKGQGREPNIPSNEEKGPGPHGPVSMPGALSLLLTRYSLRFWVVQGLTVHSSLFTALGFRRAVVLQDYAAGP